MSSVLRTDSTQESKILMNDEGSSQLITNGDSEKNIDVMWYIHQLQEEVIYLNSEAHRFKKDCEVINSVNSGANDALIAIKAELECQVEELNSQLIYKDIKIGEYGTLCSKFTTIVKGWQEEGVPLA